VCALCTSDVSFGPVTIPVQLFTAAEEHGAGFPQVHAGDGARIRHRN
jgi:DNA end-binding protein Ku